MSVFHVPPGQGESVELGGVGVQFKVPGVSTGGSFAIVEHPVEPGVIVEPHTHAHEDELSYVLEGTIWARVGDEEIEAEAGSYLWKPRGVQHTFWNTGPKPARIIELISPAGLEIFFEELGGILDDAEPDMERISELADGFGLTFDHGLIPEIEARFGSLRMI